MKIKFSVPQIIFFIFLAILAATVSFADEPTNMPKIFVARIGGFLGASYTVELREGILFYTAKKESKDVETAKITPTPAQWKEFRNSLDQLKVWHWHTNYPNSGVYDGTQWSLEIEYQDHSLKTQGDNNYPNSAGKPNGKPESTKEFDEYLKAVKMLLGDKSFE